MVSSNTQKGEKNKLYVAIWMLTLFADMGGWTWEHTHTHTHTHTTPPTHTQHTPTHTHLNRHTHTPTTTHHPHPPHHTHTHTHTQLLHTCRGHTQTRDQLGESHKPTHGAHVHYNNPFHTYCHTLSGTRDSAICRRLAMKKIYQFHLSVCFRFSWFNTTLIMGSLLGPDICLHRSTAHI